MARSGCRSSSAGSAARPPQRVTPPPRQPSSRRRAPRASAPRRGSTRRGARGRSSAGVASGSSPRQRSNAYAHRGRNLQPVGGRRSDGGWPRICESRSSSTSRRGSEPSSPHVYGCSGCSKSENTGACSATRAAYMTTMSSAVSATTPRSWVMRTTAVPCSAWSSLDEAEDLRLRRHVERGGRLVGDQERRVVDERHRDHHALAHAARELVRVVVDPALRRAGSRPPRSPAIASSRACRDVTSRCSMTASTSWLPIDSTGFSDVIGSWKIIEISLPRSARSRRFDASRRFSPRNSACPVETDVCFFVPWRNASICSPGGEPAAERHATRTSG